MSAATDANRRREELYGLLGDLPDLKRPIQARKLDEIRGDAYVLEILVLDLNGIEPVPAYFCRPPNATEGKALPTVLYNHSHGGGYDIGKDELLNGREYLHTPPYANLLTGLGYNVLCIDHWAFGERRGRTEHEIFKEMLWRGQVM